MRGWRCAFHSSRARRTSYRSVSEASQSFFSKLSLAFSSIRDKEAGCFVTSLRGGLLGRLLSGIVMSSSASTQSSRAARCAASLPLPGGRPGRVGSAEPVRNIRSTSFTAKLALTFKWRAAPRRDAPLSNHRLDTLPKV